MNAPCDQKPVDSTGKSRWPVLLRSAGAPLAIFSATIVFLTTAAARDVTLVDSGELILAATELDIAHPPGFPLYVLVGHLFSWLPMGSPAFRLSFMSAVLGALAAAVLTILSLQVRSSIAKRPKPGFSDWPALLWCTVVGIAFAVSPSPAFYATVAEVYSLNTLLFGAAVSSLVLWHSDAPTQDARLIWVGFWVGLGLGVHHISWVLWAPAFMLFIFLGLRRSSRSQPISVLLAYGRVALGSLPGLCAYIYLPWASARQPWLDWGSPGSWHGFWWHVSAGQYRSYLSQGSWTIFGENLGELGSLWLEHVTPVGLILVILGAWVLAKKRPQMLALVLVGCGCALAYAAWYDIAEDGDAYALPVLWISAWLGAVGGLHLIDGRRSPLRMGLPLVTAALLIWQAVDRFPSLDRSQDQIARHYVEDVLADVQPGGLVLTKDWQFHAPYLYLSRIEGFRRDANVVNLNLLRYSWYLDHLDRSAGDLMTACAEARRPYVEGIKRWERGQEFDADELTRLYHALIEAMIAASLPDREVHVMVPIETGVGSGYTWIPRSLTYRLHPGVPQPELEPPETRWQALLDENLQPTAKTKVRRVYGFMADQRARFLQAMGREQEAMVWLERARALEAAP